MKALPVLARSCSGSRQGDGSQLFLRISQGASRHREAMADRWAAVTFGSQAFIDGLTHVVGLSVAFDAHANATLQQVIDQRQPLANLHGFTPSSAPPAQDPATATQEALTRAAYPYDSHPLPADRFAWVSAMAIAPTEPPDVPGVDAWSLFEDREALERQMTDQIRKSIENRYGIQIARTGSGVLPGCVVGAVVRAYTVP